MAHGVIVLKHYRSLYWW